MPYSDLLQTNGDTLLQTNGDTLLRFYLAADPISDVAFWIDIISGGDKVGEGPIDTAQSYSITYRLNEAGKFSFEVPASDPRSNYLQTKREAWCYAVLDGGVTLIGAGIIDDISLDLDESGRSVVIAQGYDLLIELTYKTVGKLQLEDGAGAGTTTALADIMAYAPTGWGLSNYTTTAGTVYGSYAGGSVLNALIKVGEHEGENFRLGNNGRSVYWLRDETPSSGARAEMSGGQDNQYLGIITSLKERKLSYDLVNKIYAYGSGNGEARLDLSDATITPDTGYEIGEDNKGWFVRVSNLDTYVLEAVASNTSGSYWDVWISPSLYGGQLAVYFAANTTVDFYSVALDTGAMTLNQSISATQGAYSLSGAGSFLLVGGDDGLESFSISATDGTLTAQDTELPADSSGARFTAVYWAGDYWFCGEDAGLLYTMSVDGAGTITEVGQLELSGAVEGIYSTPAFVFVAQTTAGVSTVVRNASGVMGLVDTDDQGGEAYDVWHNGAYLLVANGTDGLRVYSVDAGGFLTSLTNDDQGDVARGVWSDGTFVYLANGTGGLHLYTVGTDGAITHIDEDDQGGEAYMVSGGGSWVVLANFTGGGVVYKADVDLQSQIEKSLSWKEISPVSNSLTDIQSAANTLYKVAHQYLVKNGSEQEAYDLSVTGLNKIVRPGETIHVTWIDKVDSYVYANIDRDLIVLQSTLTLEAARGVRTTDMTVSTTAQLPKTDEEMIAAELEQARLMDALPQTFGGYYDLNFGALALDSSGAGTKTVTLKVKFDDRVTRLVSSLFQIRTDVFEGYTKSASTASTVVDSTGSSSSETSGGGSAHSHPIDIHKSISNPGTELYYHQPTLEFRVVGTGASIIADTMQGESTHTHSNPHNHSLEIEGHGHSLDHGIFRDTTYPGNLSITINGTDQTSALLGSATVGTTGSSYEAEAELADLLNGETGGFQKTHTIVITCAAGRGRVICNLRSFVQVQAILIT